MDIARLCLVVAFLAATCATAGKTAPPSEHLPENGICGVISDGEVLLWMLELAKTVIGEAVRRKLIIENLFAF